MSYAPALDLETDHGSWEDSTALPEEPGFLRTAFGGLVGGSIMAVGCAVVWALIITITGYDFSIVALIAGVLVGTGVRSGAGRGGFLPAFIALGLTYLTVTGAVAISVFWEFAVVEGDLLLAIIGVPFSIVGYVPFLMMEMDVMGLLFIGLALFSAVQVCFADDSATEQY